MANVFVTGASGFIGTPLVWELVKRGNVVHALTHSTKLQSPPGLLPDEQPDFNHPNIRMVTGDVTDQESLRRGMDGCSQAYHLAGYAKNWARDAQTYFNINVDGLRNVCEVACELGVQRIVWTSTMLTFGPTRPGQVSDETMPRNTQKFYTDYEASKVAGEKLAADFVEGGLHVVIVNPGRVFGPGHLNESNSVTILIDMYDRGKVPFLLRGGRNVGNWVLVDDVVQGLMLAMERGRTGEKYVLGGENASLKEFFQLIDKASGQRHFQITIRRPAAMSFAWFQKLRASCSEYIRKSRPTGCACF